MSTLLALCVSGVMLHEGYSRNMYKDRNGWSIGNGYSLTQNPLHLDKATLSNFKRNGISKLRSRQLVSQLCTQTKNVLEAKYEWFNEMDSQRQYVVLNMAYNLGVGGLEDFNKTLYHIKHRQYTLASNEMLRSKWARQVKGRAIELSNIVRG